MRARCERSHVQRLRGRRRGSNPDRRADEGVRRYSYSICGVFRGKSCAGSNVAALLNLLDLRYRLESRPPNTRRRQDLPKKGCLSRSRVPSPTNVPRTVDWVGDIAFRCWSSRRRDASLGIKKTQKSVVNDVEGAAPTSSADPAGISNRRFWSRSHRWTEFTSGSIATARWRR